MVLVDHALQAADLTFDAPEPTLYRFLVIAIAGLHASDNTPKGYQVKRAGMGKAPT
jgi:hypothetical protein